jgi:hypothetical protein
MAELVLPLKDKNFSQEMASTLSDMHTNLEKYLSGFAKVYMPTAKEKVKDIKFTKMANKMVEQAFKAKWILGALKSLKSIATNTMGLAGNWILDILKFLLIMTIIDPKGKLLESLLNMFAGIFIWLVEAIAKMIPTLVKLFITIVTKILPKVFVKIVSAVFQALKGMFQQLAKQFPALAPLFKFMSSAFAKGSPLHTFFTEILPKAIPILVTAFVVMGIASKLAPAFAILLKVFSAFGTVLKFVIGGMWKLVFMLFPKAGMALMGMSIAIKGWLVGMMAMLGPVLLVVLAIGALVAIFIVIWKYSKKITDFFEGAFKKFTKWFKKASVPMKILAVLLIIILSPLLIIAGIVYGIAKFANLVKKVGWKGIWKLIKDGFFKWVNSIGEGFKETGKRIKGWVKSVKETTGKWAESVGGKIGVFFAKHLGPFIKMIQPILMKLAPVIGTIKGAIDKILTFIKDTILKTINSIKDGFNEVRDFFTIVTNVGFTKLLSADKQDWANMMKITKIARESGLDQGKVIAGEKTVKIGKQQVKFTDFKTMDRYKNVKAMYPLSAHQSKVLGEG